MFVDSHSHIDGEEFDADRDAVIERARAAQVEAIVCVGTGDPRKGDLERAVACANEYAHFNLFATVGVHPHDAKLYDDQAARQITGLITDNERVIALGEIGLDYHYDNSPRDVQRAAFNAQIKLARALDVPIVIHTRDAEDDTREILRETFKVKSQKRVDEAGERLSGVMHCFTGSLDLALDAVQLGFMISFAGIASFPKSEALCEVARNVPLDRILIETDAPFLAPVPHRGRRNEPAYVADTARSLAQTLGISVVELASATTNNFRLMFRVNF